MNGVITRNETNHGIGFAEEYDESEETKAIAELRTQGDEFVLCNNDLAADDLNERMWLVVRGLKERGRPVPYTIQEGDIIKLGRIRFRVKEFATKEKRYDGAEAGCEWEDIKDLPTYDSEKFKESQC